MMRTTLAAISGPMPSPGISVIRCFIILNGLWSWDFGLWFRLSPVRSYVESIKNTYVKAQRPKAQDQIPSWVMNQTSDRADVAIIGGGVIGLAVARALALSGVRDILLIERNSLGGESSRAAAGMLAPQAEANRAHEFFDLTCRSRDMYPAFAAALLAETGIDIELDT